MRLDMSWFRQIAFEDGMPRIILDLVDYITGLDSKHVLKMLYQRVDPIIHSKKVVTVQVKKGLGNKSKLASSLALAINMQVKQEHREKL